MDKRLCDSVIICPDCLLEGIAKLFLVRLLMTLCVPASKCKSPWCIPLDKSSSNSCSCLYEDTSYN